uniref:Integrase, catalytic region, zinc finger, CCHC-type, peptidase aspartic, catalytic n=1 Tax=Tanacetum cinerariifolium TaxID=118510 RepID=A0A6L2MJ31_TANCI|nr:integrase, catalytic region, zinc finger, CCHC-type, peptidase aspartic, catalytic [Tanacetum cinerariifolium]
MSRDVLTVGSTMRIPLLYRGEYSQWRERFMNYLEEQTNGEAMINSIKNGDQPLPCVNQVSIARTTSTEQPLLKDKSMCSDQEKKIKKIDHLARSFLIQGLSNDIYSLIDSNKIAKDIWDALARHMFGSEYGKQDRKAAVLYEYKTFKATEGELLLDTYIYYLQVINDLKKCGYSKDNCELNFKFLNNLQLEWKQYAIMMRQNKNLMDINIDSLYNILKKNQGDVNDAMGLKKKTVVVTSDLLDLIAEKIKVGKRKEEVVVSLDSDESNDDELKNITALLAKAFNRNKFYSKPTNNNLRTSSASNSANKKQEYMNSDDKKEDKKQTSSLKPYVPTVILEKIIIDFEDEVVSLLVKEKENLETIESLKSKGLESSEKEIFESGNQNENDCQVVEKVCDNVDNLKVITPEMFKLSVSQSVSPISVTKMSCSSNSVETKLKRKRRKRTSSKHNVNQKNIVVSCDNKDFVHFLDLDTFNSVRRSKLNDVVWKKKGSSNTIKDNLSYVHHSNLNKNVKFYSCKNLMAGNNSDTHFACNNARNAFCNSYDVDMNDLFVFDDVSIRKSQVSKMNFRKKPSASLNVPSSSKLNKSLPRIVRKWLPKMKPLAEPVAKWIPRVTRQIDKIAKTPNSQGPIFKWIIDSGCSKHMTGNRALLTNFVEKFLGMVRFGNNDFAVIARYGDVIIGSMTTKKVYYVEGLCLNLFSVEQFCDKGLEVAFQKSACFVRNENGVDLW